MTSTPGCYISYANAPTDWTLGDGSPPPDKKPFLNPTYDAATRTFTGNIEWAPSTFGGDARWEYQMVFSEDFSSICGGGVRSFNPSGALTRTIPFSQSFLPFTRGGGLTYKRADSHRMQMMMQLRRSIDSARARSQR